MASGENHPFEREPLCPRAACGRLAASPVPLSVRACVQERPACVEVGTDTPSVGAGSYLAAREKRNCEE